MADCVSCKAPDARNRCGGCKSVYYCNVDCQRNHWKTHKKVCKYKKKKNKKSSTKSSPNADTSNKSNEEKKGDDNYHKKEIKQSLEFIADNKHKYLDRLDCVSELLQPPNAQKFVEIEKAGVWNIFDKVLEFAYNYLIQLKEDKLTQETLNIQLLSLHFASAIVMKKLGTFDGTDTCTESNCLKLLHHTSFWGRNLEMIVMETCHIEYKRLFFRIFTLMLNFQTCGKYILENLMDIKNNKQQETQLNNLISSCADSVDSPSQNALQGLANQCFCQLYIHCEQLNIRKDLKDYLESKKTLYFQIMYGMAKAQMNKGSALSFDDMNEIIKKRKMT